MCASVIYLVVCRSPAPIRPYSRMLLLCATADAYLIFADLWCRSVSAFLKIANLYIVQRLQIKGGLLLVSFTGFGSLFESYWLQCFVSIPLQASAGMLNCAVVPANSYYRYYLTKK